LRFRVARTAVTVTPLKSEPLLRLLICDLVGEEVTRESLAGLRDDIADLRRRLDNSERSAEDLPHREKYLLLVIDFFGGLLDLHEQLVGEVERAFPAPRRKRQVLRTRSPQDLTAVRAIWRLLFLGLED
jgi:hypothetical protein